eukprot:COSAG02_NODE_3331_length_6920_cov_2.706641_2_plen_112_part_00
MIVPGICSPTQSPELDALLDESMTTARGPRRAAAEALWVDTETRSLYHNPNPRVWVMIAGKGWLLPPVQLDAQHAMWVIKLMEPRWANKDELAIVYNTHTNKRLGLHPRTT